VDDRDLAELTEAVAALTATLAQETATLSMTQVAMPFGHVLQALAPQPWFDAPVAEKTAVMSSEDWVRASLAAIARSAPGKLAWMSIDADAALEAARHCDDERRQGRVRGPLHGMPVGIKDMFDLKGRVAGWGTPLRSDSAPARID